MQVQAFPARKIGVDAQDHRDKRSRLQAVILLTAFLLLKASLSAQDIANGQLAQTSYLRICGFMKSGNYSEALSESKKAIEQVPQFPPTYGKLIEAADALGQLAQAESYFNELLRVRPPNLYAYYGLAAIQRRLKNPVGAIAVARQCQNALPDFVPCYVIQVDAWHSNLRKPEEAESYLKLVIENNPDLSAAHYALGYLYYLSGKWSAGLAALEKSLSLNPSLTDAEQVKALIYYYNSRYREALEIHQRLLKRANDQKDIDRQLRAQVSIGILYRLLGNYTEAIRQLKASWQIAVEIGDRAMQNTCLSNLGAVCFQQDDYSQALRFVQEGVLVAQALRDRRSEGRYLGNLGEIYYALGNIDQAIVSSEQGLMIARELEDKNNVASISTDLGRFYTDQGKFEEAQNKFEEAAQITRGNNNRTLERDALAGQATLHYKQGKFVEALSTQQRALELARLIASPAREGDTLNSLGFLYLQLARSEEALLAFQSALTIGERIQVARIIWQANAGQAAVYEKKQQPEEARLHYQKAVEVMESVRAQLVSEEDKVGFFQNKTEIYKKLIAVLLRPIAREVAQERTVRAFEFSERARARAFLDLLDESKIHVEQSLAADLLEQRQRITANFSQLNAEILKERTQEPAKQNKAAIERLEQARNKVDDEYANWLREVRRRDARYATLKYSVPLSLEQTQQLLDEHTVLLSYSLGEPSSVLFAVSHNGVKAVPLAGSAKEIGQDVSTLISAISNRSVSDFRRLSVQLYERLIQPAGALLKGKNTLIIVPDGALHRLPFEVLLPPSARRITQPDQRKLPYLVRDYVISYAPSASVLAGLQDYHRATAVGQKMFGAFADPVYDAEAQAAGSTVALATRSVQGKDSQWLFRRLVHSREETAGIAKLFPREQAEVFQGVEATEEKAKTPGLLERYRLLHFAAHGLINQNRPRFSGIVLSLPAKNVSVPKPVADASVEDGILQVYEIFQLKLNADLVVLSACETGLGREVNGEGLIGLTRAFIYAGTPSLLVSLWKVDDEKTADLMIRFYTHLKAGKSKAAALRQAQLDLIETVGTPYFWAPFVLIGKAQ